MTSILKKKIQDSRHKELSANGNIIFLIAYTMRFPKNVYFSDSPKILMKITYELDYDDGPIKLTMFHKQHVNNTQRSGIYIS